MSNPALFSIARAARSGKIRIALAVFLCTAGLVFLLGSYLAPHYTAAAILIRASSAPQGMIRPLAEADPGQSNPYDPAQTRSPGSGNPSLQELVSDEQISEINNQAQVYPSLVLTVLPGWTISQTRNHLSIVPAADAGAGEEKVRLLFSGRDKDSVLGVTNAVANVLSRPGRRLDDSAAVLPEATLAPSTRPEAPPSTETPPSSVGPQKLLLTFSALRRKIEQQGERQTILGQQLQQQTNALATIQEERQRLASASKDKVAADRDRQFKKHDASEAALKAQLAAATQVMNDLGQRYTESYPEYLTAKDHVDELQTRLNQFQSKPFAFVPEGTPDNSKRIAELNQDEAAVKATLQVLEGELDRNQVDTARLQTQVARWSSAFNAGNKSDTGKTGLNDKSANSGDASRSVDQATASNSTLPRTAAASHGSSADEVAYTGKSQGFSILQNAQILSSSRRISFELLTLVSLAFGLITASTSVLVVDKADDTIKSEEDLRDELPGRIRYLGGIPRIKHEIITR